MSDVMGEIIRAEWPAFVARWLKANGAEGMLTEDDVIQCNAGSRRVFDLMKDRLWHTAASIRLAAGSNGMPASEGLKRMRELRPMLAPFGCRIEEQRLAGSRHFIYRITEPTEVMPTQGDLFSDDQDDSNRWSHLTDAEFVSRARSACANTIRNTNAGKWLEESLSRLEQQRKG